VVISTNLRVNFGGGVLEGGSGVGFGFEAKLLRYAGERMLDNRSSFVNSHDFFGEYVLVDIVAKLAGKHDKWRGRVFEEVIEFRGGRHLCFDLELLVLMFANFTEVNLLFLKSVGELGELGELVNVGDGVKNVFWSKFSR
jgi:hypothetical protein